MTPSVSTAIEGLKKAFPNCPLTVLSEDGQGGAFVILDNVELGEKFAPQHTWLGAHLVASLPYADIYPLYMGEGVRKADGAALVGPFQHVVWQGRPSIQVSRKNNRFQVGHTAASKFVKVIEFIRSCA